MNMMKTIPPTALLTAPTLAAAHGGMHEHGLFAGLSHLLSSPYHLAGIGAALAVVWFAVRMLKKNSES